MEQRKLLLSILVVGMFSTAALAVVPIGPPVASLVEGQYAVGIGYARADLELDLSGAGVAWPGRKPVQNAEINLYHACLGYGISDTWNAHVLLGLSTVEADADTIPVGNDYGSDSISDSKFTFGLGTKKTLHDNGNGTKWGTAFQYTRGRSKDKISTPGSFGNGATLFGGLPPGLPITLEIDWYIMQLAMGPAYQVNEDVCLYGGPFLMFLEADGRATNVGVVFETEQVFELGGFIGTMINLGGNAGMNLEFLFTAESWGGGIGFSFPL